MTAALFDIAGVVPESQLKSTEYHNYPLPPFPKSRFYPKRDGLGRYKLPSPDPADKGKIQAYTRATTIAKILDDTYNLEVWKLGNVLHGIAVKPEIGGDLIAMVERLGGKRPEKKDLGALAREAGIAAGDQESSEFGTALHAWLEFIDLGLGTIHDVPEMFQAHVFYYLQRLALAGLTAVPEYVERIVYNAEGNVVGTLDRIYLDSDGDLVLGDVKSSKTLEYSYLSIAVQLGIYHSALFILAEDGKSWLPMPKLKKKYAVVLHCPSGPTVNDPTIPGAETTSAVTFDMAHGRAALTLALMVKGVRADAKKVIPNMHATAIPSVVQSHRHMCIFEMRTSYTLEILNAVFEKYRDIFDEELNAIGFQMYESIASKTP